MANLDGGYDATGGETMGDRTILEPGEYTAALVKSEKKGPNDKGNSMIACEFEVTDGEKQGRRFWSNLNLWNTNSMAVDIAQRELNSIMHACGKLRIADTEELHGIPMRVTLKIEKGGAKAGGGNYDDANRPTAFKPLNDAPVQQSITGQQTGQAGG